MTNRGDRCGGDTRGEPGFLEGESRPASGRRISPFGPVALVHIDGKIDVTQVETTDQLSDWLTQHVNRENRAATQTLMKTLSVQAMTTYETALVEWLAADKKTVTKE